MTNENFYYSRIITDIFESEKTYLIKTKNAKLTDVFKSINSKNSFIPDFSNIVSKLDNVKIKVDNNSISFSVILYDKDGDNQTKKDQIRGIYKSTYVSGGIDFELNKTPLIVTSNIKMNNSIVLDEEVNIEYGPNININDYLENKIRYQIDEDVYKINKKIPFVIISFIPKQKNLPFKISPELRCLVYLDIDFKGIAKTGFKSTSKTTLSLKADATTLFTLKPTPSAKLEISNPNMFIDISGKVNAEISPLAFGIDVFFPQFFSDKENYISITSHPINFSINSKAQLYANSLGENCINLSADYSFKTKVTLDSYIDALFGNAEITLDKTLIETEWKHDSFFEPFEKCLNLSNSESIEIIGDLNFNEVEVGTSKNLDFTIKNKGDGVISFSEINMPSNFSHNLNQSVTLNKNETKTITITFSPSEAKNYSNQVITIKTNVGDEEVVCYGVGKESASSESLISLSGDLNFTTTEVGSTSQKTFTIKNTGNKSFNVSNISFPNNVYSANWDSGTVNANDSQDVIVTFQPINAISYNGTITVNNNADNGTYTMPISGNGTNGNTGNSDIKINDITFDDEGNGEYDINVDFINIGNKETPNNETINIEYFVNGNSIGTDTHSNMSPNENRIEYYNDYEFPYEGMHNVEIRISQVSNETEIFNNSKTISFDNSSSNGGNITSITPTDTCNGSPIIEVNKFYNVNVDISNYELYSPTGGESYDGKDIRGMWLEINVPDNWSGNHTIAIVDVSSNFDPVIAIKTICSSSFYLYQPNTSLNYGNINGYGQSDGFVFNANASNRFFVRIYHYYGHEKTKHNF